MAACYCCNYGDAFHSNVTSGNKKQVDRAIHDMVGVTYKDCPTTWKKLKQEIVGDEQKRRELIKKLQNAIR